MRVFYDHQVTSLQDAGGSSRYHYEILKHLGGSGAIRALALLGGTQCVFPYGELRSTGVRVYNWPSRLRAGYARYAANEAVTAVLAPMQGSFDVYHASYFRALPWVRRRRLVVTHHDCVQERYPELFHNAASIYRMKRKLYAQADRILCVSATSQTDLLHFFDVDASKTEVIHHGFTSLRTGSSASALEPRGSDAPYILYVGSRARYKNFDLLLSSFASSRSARELHLKAAGGGVWTERETRLIGELGLNGRVHLARNVSEPELAALYRGASLFVYPSLYEGFGFPPLEAMSEGCPALVSSTSCMPEICGDAAFYFDPTSREELQMQLDRLLNDASLRASKRLAGLERAGTYRWPLAAQKTLAAYQRALDES